MLGRLGFNPFSHGHPQLLAPIGGGGLSPLKKYKGRCFMQQKEYNISKNVRDFKIFSQLWQNICHRHKMSIIQPNVYIYTSNKLWKDKLGVMGGRSSFFRAPLFKDVLVWRTLPLFFNYFFLTKVALLAYLKSQKVSGLSEPLIKEH